MTIALFGNRYRIEALRAAVPLLSALHQNTISILIEKSFYEFLKQHGASPLYCDNIIENQYFNADMALSLGGDGTFLNAAMKVGDKGIPIVGINTGKLGFLADIADSEIDAVLQLIITKNYYIEERTVIQLINNTKTIEYPFALNEIALLKQDSSSMITIHVKTAGEILNSYHADGLIIATPTGSTAYSMSVGGPIVVPQANNLILSPVAPHSLTVRPLIIPDNWRLEIKVDSRTKSFLVALDGRSVVMDHNANLTVCKAGYTIKVVKQANHTFFSTLKNKLMWGADKRTE